MGERELNTQKEKQRWDQNGVTESGVDGGGDCHSHVVKVLMSQRQVTG
jgi:hypothetical protein